MTATLADEVAAEASPNEAVGTPDVQSTSDTGLWAVLLRERWIQAGAALTAGSGVAAYSLLPITGMVNWPSYSVALLWFTLAAMVLACLVFRDTLRMLLRGEERPFAALLAKIDAKQGVVIFAGTILLALNLAFFCMIKPQLGQLVAFSADSMLADLDHFIFAGDPWRHLTWFSHPVLSLIYHRGWFLWLAFVTFFVLRMDSGDEKDRLFISYFMLWSLFGPLVHLAMPAAGPVFYDDLGLGDRFAGLIQEPYTRGAANYLWTGYVNKTFNPAGGISAMPSLHLATMFWSLIAVRNTRWFAFGIAFTIYIFLGSVAIGWHYAVDGIVGGIGAAFCYWFAGLKSRGVDGPVLEQFPAFAGTVGAVERRARSEAA